jgi:LysM repeat protein
MLKQAMAGVAGLGLALALSGCVVRTYPLTRDRVDQDLNLGNRGFVSGEAKLEDTERPTTRTTQVVEVELRSPLRFEKCPKTKTTQVVASEPSSDLEGNKGFISESIVPEAATTNEGGLQQYTVQKGDTLQKISRKFYGTTKKWQKLYELNQDTLSSPNKLKPGQVINVPMQAGQESGSTKIK